MNPDRPLKLIPSADFVPVGNATMDSQTLDEARAIVEAVRAGGWKALREYALRFGDCGSGDPLTLTRSDLERTWLALDTSSQAVLERVRDRIVRFARAQRESFTDVSVEIPGGRAGHRWAAIERAGCYVPGGRYPLPSSALMSIATARVAGCKQVLAASPNPGPLVQAAAFVAGADALLCVGGAAAIAGLAYGLSGSDADAKAFAAPCDLIVGPGNRWVTAAKKLVHGDVGIDMLAGPSELVVIANHRSDPGIVAADLLAQAEHDADARVYLVTTARDMIDRVNRELEQQLSALATASVARAALERSAGILADDPDDIVRIVHLIAPEHLEVHDIEGMAPLSPFERSGCVFVGPWSAEVFGDYGIGPNHTLPTGGTARFSSGLSVLTFLRATHWVAVDAKPPDEVIQDTLQFAEWEKLEAHAASIRARLRRLPAN